MNNIETFGGVKRQRNLVTEVAHFCIEKLMPRMRSFDIEILLTKLGGAKGYCLMTDNNRTFEIEIEKKMSDQEIITTVCHEMVHVKQYARKEITDTKGYWKGNIITEDQIAVMFPWETEAYRLEKYLTIKFNERKVNDLL